MVDRHTVLMWPDYTGANPYQVALIEGIDGTSFAVTARDDGGLFPLIRSYRSGGHPDLIHLHWLHRYLIPQRVPAWIAIPLGLRLIVELLILRWRGVTIVWTVHNLLTHGSPIPRVETGIRHILVRLSDRVIVHCDAAAELVRKRYRVPSSLAERIEVVAHGNYDGCYPSGPTRSEARVELELPDDHPVLLFFGQIRRYKNVTGLIEAFRDADPEATLLVVGKPRSPELADEVRAATGGDRRVRTELRYVPDEKVSTYFQAADAVVLPFADVLTSGSVILAMSFGKAIVAPDLGCIPGLIGCEGGVTFDPEAGDDLKRAISDVVRSHRLEEMGERNRGVANDLDWDGIGSRTAAVYHRAISG